MLEPLWRVMRSAYAESSGTISSLREPELPGSEREEFAVMLRAIAEETEKRWAWCDVNEVVHWLRSEAARAEAGE